jgi:hypothetical protein
MQRIAALAFLVLALCAVAPLAAQTTATLRVSVVAAFDGEPMPGATVTISGGSLMAPRICVTNGRGTCVFPSVPTSSHCDVLIEVPGFATKQADIGRIDGGTPRHILAMTDLAYPDSCRSLPWKDLGHPSAGTRFIWPVPDDAHWTICL